MQRTGILRSRVLASKTPPPTVQDEAGHDVTIPAMGVREELIVFLGDRRTGRTHGDEWTLKCGIGGVVLPGLALAKRIVAGTRVPRLAPMVDATPAGIKFLDEIPTTISEHPGERGAQHWVGACASRAGANSQRFQRDF